MSNSYRDRDGNVYRIEQAYNGKWVVVRYNSGGHRKQYKQIAPDGNRRKVAQLLDDIAELSRWEDAVK